MSVSEWHVVCVPVDEVDEGSGKNLAGLSVVLTNGEARREVARVAFARENSRYPKVSFQEKLAEAVGKATLAAETLNDLEEEEARLRELAEEELAGKAAKRIREVLGEPSRSAKPD